MVWCYTLRSLRQILCQSIGLLLGMIIQEPESNSCCRCSTSSQYPANEIDKQENITSNYEPIKAKSNPSFLNMTKSRIYPPYSFCHFSGHKRIQVSVPILEE